MRKPAQAIDALRLRWLFAAACSVALAGCPAAPPGAAPASSPGSASAKPGPITLTIAPAPPRQLVPSTFTAAVRPAPAPGTSVIIQLTMPSMAMPPTVISLKPAGKGIYRGSGAFTMGGDWQATVAVSGPGRLVSEVVPVSVK